MDIQQILSALRSERARIDAAITALEGTQRRPGRPAKNDVTSTGRRGRRGPMSAAAKRKLSEQMKKRWAERKAMAKKKAA